MDKNILLVSIPLKENEKDYDYDDYDDSNEDSDDDSWEPPKKKIKFQKPTKLTLKIQKPRPIHTLSDLIDVLDRSTKTISKKNKKGEKTKILKSLYTPDERKRVGELVNNLRDLQNMIGMENVKKNIVNQLLLFLQDLNDPDMFLHTVLTGNPGSGKTTLCGILAKIYKSMGLLDKNEITIADRPSLVGQWLGETAIKTKKLLDSASGGILLIDEAYSLGNDDGKDSFSKECIDTINQYLSENNNKLICIIAGYKDDLDKCFFAINQGLNRRFPWRYDIENYSPQNLQNIFQLQASKKNWKINATNEFLSNLFQQNKELFNNNGGDTTNFLEKCKISHAQRIFGTSETKKLLTTSDLDEGLRLFKESKNIKKNDVPYGIYC